MNDQSRIIATVSYITLVGWVIALILRQNEKPKSELGLFHLRQAFGLMILSFAVSITKILFAFISLGFIGDVLGIVFLIFWILGLISAIQGRFYKLPYIGGWMQENFTFIN